MITATSAEVGVPRERSIKGGTVPAFQAFRILRWGVVAAPILMGADKFLDLLCNWEQYLAPSLLGLSPLSAAATMRAVARAARNEKMRTAAIRVTSRSLMTTQI